MQFNLSLFLCFCAYFVQSQTLRIKNIITNEPLEFVVVSSEKPFVFSLSNAKGEVDISEFISSDKINISLTGYNTLILSYEELKSQEFNFGLEPRNTQLNEIVIAATKRQQFSKTLPHKISVIGKSDAEFLQPQTTADLLATSGEVFMQKSQQGGGSPMIRGFATNRLIYSVDGVRMNTAIFRAGNIQNVISLDAFAIERTEVFFGPGSVIYGSDAIGGVMSFTTLTPQFSVNDTVRVSGKSNLRFSSANNELTNHLAVNIAGKKWASVTSITYSDFGDLKMGKFGPDEYLKNFTVSRIDNQDRMVQNPNSLVQNPSGYNQFHILQKIRFKPNKNWDFTYAFHFSETSEYSRYDRLIETQNNGLPVSAVWNYGPQKWGMQNLAIDYKKANKIMDLAQLKMAYQNFEESRIDRRFNHHRLRTNLEEVKAYSVNLDFTKILHKNHFYYGAEYVLNDVFSKGSAVDIRDGSAILVPNRYPNSNWQSWGTYINYQRLFSDKVVFQSGLRYNNYIINSNFTQHLQFYPFDFTQSKVNNNATTGTVGFVFSPTPSWKISPNFSTGFRAPNVDDMGKIFEFVAGQIVVPNTNLKAEYVYNSEINISKYFGNWLKLDFTVFYSYLNNAMVRRPFSVNNQDSILYDGNMSRVYAIQNAAFATVFGGNFGTEIYLPRGFKIISKYNYQLGMEEMDNGNQSRSRHAAPSFGVTRLVYSYQKLVLQVFSFYSAQVSYANLNIEEQQKAVIYAKDALGNPYSPSWYTINFKAQYSINQNFTINAGIDNLTDVRYRPYSSGLVAPGRNFIMAIQARF
jgi:hemoglobin/transferrin/lactoferrin receptor protein